MRDIIRNFQRLISSTTFQITLFIFQRKTWIVYVTATIESFHADCSCFCAAFKDMILKVFLAHNFFYLESFFLYCTKWHVFCWNLIGGHVYMCTKTLTNMFVLKPLLPPSSNIAGVTHFVFASLLAPRAHQRYLWFNFLV